MTRIQCLTTFLRGRDRFEAGDVRNVPAEDAALFIARGWAAEPGADAQPLAEGDVTLTPVSTTHGQTAAKG